MKSTPLKLRNYRKGFVIGTKNFFTCEPMPFSAKAVELLEIAYLA